MLIYQVLGPVDGGGVSADVRVDALQRGPAGTYELYHRATFPPASAMAVATARPIPSAAPVITTTLPLRRSCSTTLDGVSGKGLGNPSRTLAQSSNVMDMVAVKVNLVKNFLVSLDDFN